MKLGFNLLLWTTHVTDAHLPVIERLKATGYDGVEIPIFEGTPEHYRDLGRRLADLGLAATGIGILPAGKSCVSADAGERRAALDHIRWLVDCTAALGGDVAAGPFHQTLGVFSGRGPSADEISRCAEIHKQAARHAAGAGIGLAVEPLNRFECYFLNSAAQAADLVQRVDEPKCSGRLRQACHHTLLEDTTRN